MTPITHYFKAKEEKYDLKNVRQKGIRKAIVSFIVKGAQPLALVENDAFRAMIEECDGRFSHITRYVSINAWAQNSCH